MQIQGSDAFQLATPLPRDTAATNTTGTGSTDQTSTDASIDSTDSLGNETTFLQLLVAQIQNQDPTQPMDSSTFLTQLAQFTQVEQLIGIRQDVQELDPATTSGTAATDSTSGS
jgi:flagellar basal-body rod modification protein FlgD